jgi:hypothetical protein
MSQAMTLKLNFKYECVWPTYRDASHRFGHVTTSFRSRCRVLPSSKTSTVVLNHFSSRPSLLPPSNFYRMPHSLFPALYCFILSCLGYEFNSMMRRKPLAFAFTDSAAGESVGRNQAEISKAVFSSFHCRGMSMVTGSPLYAAKLFSTHIRRTGLGTYSPPVPPMARFPSLFVSTSCALYPLISCRRNLYIYNKYHCASFSRHCAHPFTISVPFVSLEICI